MRVISHSEYNVDEHFRHSFAFPSIPILTTHDRQMQVCLLLVVQLYFPLFSVKVATDMLIIPAGNSLPLALGDTQP